MKAITGLHAVVLSIPLLGLSACNGGGSGGEPLTLSGKVIAPAAGGSEVTVTVGNKPYVVQADDEGKFEIELRSSNADVPVAIQTKLDGDLSFVELISKLGSFGDLLAAAGDDATLTADENIRANVSSFSTADAVLEEEAVGTNAGKTFELGAGVDPDEALTLAAVLELAIARPQAFELPEGTPTTLALARDATARDRFIAGIKRTAATAFELSKEQILIDADIVGAPATGLPGEMIVSIFGGDKADERAPLALCYGCSYRTSGFSFDADGTGTFFADFVGVETTWRRIGTVLQVRFPTPLETEFTELGPCDGGNDTQRVVRQDVGYDLVMLSDTAVSTTRVARLNSPDCPSRPTRTLRTTVAGTLLTDSNTTPVTAAQFAGQKYVLPVLKPTLELQDAFDVQFEPDIIAFDGSSAAGGRYVLDDATWSLDDGYLQLSYAGDTVGRYRIARDIDGRAQLMLADFSRSGKRFVTVARAFSGNDFAAFATDDVPGQYFYLGAGNEFDDDPRLEGLRLRLDADGKGAVAEDDINSAGEVVVSESSYKVRWTVEGNGDLEFRRYQNAEDVDAGCDERSETCEQLDARRFVPVARVGERFYVLDRREFIDSNTGAVRLSFNAPMFYDRVALDAAKSAAATGQRFSARDRAGSVFGPPLQSAR